MQCITENKVQETPKEKKTELTREISETRESWSCTSEAKEQRSTLAEAEEKRLKLDSWVKITESGLASRAPNPNLSILWSWNPSSAILNLKMTAPGSTSGELCIISQSRSFRVGGKDRFNWRVVWGQIVYPINLLWFKVIIIIFYVTPKNRCWFRLFRSN